MVSATPRPFYLWERYPVPIVKEAGWAPGPVWTNAGNFVPTGFRSPARLSRSYRHTDCAILAHEVSRYSDEMCCWADWDLLWFETDVTVVIMNVSWHSLYGFLWHKHESLPWGRLSVWVSRTDDSEAGENKWARRQKRKEKRRTADRRSRKK